MAEVIYDKRQMYDLLARGLLGCTVPQYFDLESWRGGPHYGLFEVWGVRSLLASGRCRLFCPRAEVPAEFALHPPGTANVSPMIDCVCGVTLMAEAWVDDRSGLTVYGIENLGGERLHWRRDMPTRGVQTGGVAARMLLRRHLNENSLDDLYALLERYEGHVVEFSATDRQCWTLPHRNAVVWEVRPHRSNHYELNSWKFHTKGEDQ